ncbi:MAG: hypothetical protein NXI04_01640 [Planctomycetaceae bacterium]|nr:hypothetical protein [Planctomycetaceae bacterium]
MIVAENGNEGWYQAGPLFVNASNLVPANGSQYATVSARNREPLLISCGHPAKWGHRNSDNCRENTQWHQQGHDGRHQQENDWSDDKDLPQVTAIIRRNDSVMVSCLRQMLHWRLTCLKATRKSSTGVHGLPSEAFAVSRDHSQSPVFQGFFHARSVWLL